MTSLSIKHIVRADTTVMRGVRAAVIFVAFLEAVVVAFHPDLGLFLYGIASGALYGLLAVGIVLIYRTNRIVNFAAAALGAVPATLAVLLELKKGWPYWTVVPIALIGGPILGALADLTVIRRFSNAPRLILTVATIGISQIMALIAFYIPQWLGNKAQTLSILETPWRHYKVTRRGHPLFTGDYVAAVVAVVVIGLGLALFLRYTRMGVALRASAENADRASLLGIPVRRVGTVAWTIAGFLASVTIFLRAPIIGITADGTLGYNILLYTLAAAVVARMESISVALGAGIAIGILEQASVQSTGSGNLASAIMLVIILIALLTQRREMARAHDSGVSTWQATKEYRPIPAELRNTSEVLTAKLGLGAALLFVAVCAPFPWLHLISRAGQVENLTLLPIYAIVAVSLVILSGWAGQISLGQFALVGAGSTIAGKLAAAHNVDFFVAVILAILAGALIAVIVGIPALRVQGLYLAVTTLALAGATEFYFLDRHYWFGRHVLPEFGQTVRRPVLWQRVVLTDRTMYYVCVVALLIAVLAARSFRRNRSGRVLIAARDNQRAAPAYAINLPRTKLAAFAISGALAGFAGALLAYLQGHVNAAAYGIVPSINVFVAAVMGGLTSLPGAVAGAVLIFGVKLFGEEHLKGITFFVTGPGLLLILLFLPGGLAQGFYQVRDQFLRWVANTHNILVPSLVADRRVETLEQERDVVTAAEQRVIETVSFDVLAERTIACPVCGDVLSVDDAPLHEHLRVPALVGAGADGLGEAEIVEIDLPDDGDGGGAGGGRSRLRRARKDRS